MLDKFPSSLACGWDLRRWASNILQSDGVCLPRAQIDMARLLASGQGAGQEGADGQPRKRGRGRPLGSKTKVWGSFSHQASTGT